MRSSWTLLLAGLGFAGFAWSTLDARRVARLAGEAEVALRAARSELAAARAALQAAEQRAQGHAAHAVRLEGELENALGYAHALGEALTAESEAREQAAVASAAQAALVAVPTPPGVRRCLQALRECLAADGFTGLRPLRAGELVDRTLADVEFLDGSETERNGVIVAAALTATLDRARAEVALTFRDGVRRVDGVRTELPAAGFCVRLRPVTGPMWEARLPYFVQAEGRYPPDAAEQRSPVPTMDPLTRAEWIDRLDALLAEAGTELDLRVAGFADLHGGVFRSARLFGYDRGRLLAFAADCERLAVEIDDRAGVVSLWLADGTLRREGVESTIHGDGYRMLLPNVTAARAAERMYGMVVHR